MQEDPRRHETREWGSTMRLREMVSLEIALAGLLVAAPGCFEKWKGRQADPVDVWGSVRIGSAPISGGWIEFLPIDGAVGHLRSAPIGPDGQFRATRVARGRNVVRIMYPPPHPPVNRLFQSFQTPLRLEVDGRGPVDIDLSQLPRPRSGAPAHRG